MNQYRFDKRSEAEFKKDIKLSSRIELDIVTRMCYIKFKETGVWPKLVATGCGFSGEFIKNNKQVSSFPDYSIDDQYYEITRSNSYCPRFYHQKLKKVDNIIKNGWNIVFCNGYFPLKPSSFCVCDAPILEKLTAMSLEKYGIAKQPFTLKPCYRYDIAWSDESWQSLPVIDVELPQSYIDLLDSLES